jgi:hypothetical protein
MIAFLNGLAFMWASGERLLKSERIFASHLMGRGKKGDGADET